MNILNIFLGLLGQTQGRDKILRLVQYTCLHSVDHVNKGSTYKVYKQMRMVRKVLRFLGSLQYYVKIKEQIPKLTKSINTLPNFLKHLTHILQNLFTILFFLTDHKVFLSQIGIIQKKHATQNFSLSMRFYFFQNFFGVIHNLIQMGLQILKSKQNQKSQNLKIKIKKFAFDLIRCLLDTLVALYYWKLNLPAKKIGILGVITSIMGILQSLQLF